jgi:3-hydroxyacyl-CoA dehydrogenase
MQHADEVGLDKILADIREFAAEDSHFWTPAPLLVELAEAGKTFGDLNNA